MGMRPQRCSVNHGERGLYVVLLVQWMGVARMDRGVDLQGCGNRTRYRTTAVKVSYGFKNSRERTHRKAGKLMWEMGGGLQQMGVAVW